MHLTGNGSVSSKAKLIHIVFQTLSEPKVSYLTLGILIFQKSVPVINEFYAGTRDSPQLNTSMSLISFPILICNTVI